MKTVPILLRLLILSGVLLGMGGEAPPLVTLADKAPSILVEARYFGTHNFLGVRVDGYLANTCLLTAPAASALSAAQKEFEKKGYTLKVYDCYRPQRAVNHFVRWAEDLGDTKMKAEFYPKVGKDTLFRDGYIASKSGHSRGSTVDLTLVKLPVVASAPFREGQRLRPCTAKDRFGDNSIDMGTGYDCFDVLSHTENPGISPTAKKNRMLLRSVLLKYGFENYSKEWWHFTLKGEPFPDTYFDVPVK